MIDNYLCYLHDSKGKCCFLILCFVLLGVLSQLRPAAASILFLFFLFSSFYINRILPVCFYLIGNVIHIETNSMTLILIWSYLAVISLYYIKKSDVPLKTLVLPSVVFFINAIFSNFFGINVNWITCYQMVVSILIMIFIAYIMTKKDSVFVLLTFLSTGLLMLFIVYWQIFTGRVFETAQGSIGFAEHAKSLSVPVIIIAYISVYLLLNFRRYRLQWYNILFCLILVLSTVGLVLLTYSRGVLISFIVAGLYLVVRSIKGNFFITLFSAFVMFFAFSHLLSNLQLNESLMFDNLEGGNGRTEIWASFINQMETSQSVLIGFGSGNTKDISLLGYYSHSSILDFFFCYGIGGLIYIVYLLCNIGFSLKQHNDVFFMGVYILFVLMFSTHGSSSGILFNCYIGLTAGVALSYRKLNS